MFKFGLVSVSVMNSKIRSEFVTSSSNLEVENLEISNFLDYAGIFVKYLSSWQQYEMV